MELKTFLKKHSSANLAKAIRVTPSAVSQWINDRRPIPEDRCPSIERFTGGTVLCEAMRDDITWFRVTDKSWPHPKGRPLVDYAKSKSVR